ncbi:sulfite exporter TauE/SafE family protein [Nocardia sp. NPDC059240]|uniref:sulfite exporter TauE/SafE family protein n=1 Tax=Nocardia sp. NPDC059240 TaxID=3346786 RepID=UPI0036742C1C
MTSFLILLFFGCLTGATTVLFGFGGGFVTVPVVYAVTAGAHAMHVAVATSAAVMIVNASIATATHARSGGLRWEYLRPLAGWIALGAAVGAMAAGVVPDRTLRLLFAVYLVIAIADIVLRDGFLTTTGRAGAPAAVGSMVSGFGIGAAAAFLGVGGSVLTVPLLRRKGLPMMQATALANALSLPVAVVASIVYFGDIDLTAAAGLLAGALPTIAVVERSLFRVPDRVHAIAYPSFLTVVLIGMVAAVSPW